MTDYESSSHLSHWIFSSPQQLSELRSRANLEGRKYIETTFKKAIEAVESKDTPTTTHSSSSSSNGNVNSSTNPAPPFKAACFAIEYSRDKTLVGEKNNTLASDVQSLYKELQIKYATAELDNEYLTPSEEMSIINFYCSKLFLLIGPTDATLPRLRRDIKVVSTAAILYKRFYLSNSVMLFDPKCLMVASAFLASKVEDTTMDIRDLEEGTKSMSAHVSIPDILSAEVNLVAGIHFNLLCFHPYKTVLAYTEDLRSFLKSTDGRGFVNVSERISGEDLRPIYDEARDLVQCVVLGGSDIPLLASPGQIGLAAMMVANQRLVEKNGGNGIQIDYEGYLKYRFQDHNHKGMIESVLHQVNKLCELVKKCKEEDNTVDLVVLKGIHKKLKGCCTWDNSSNKSKKKKKSKKRSHEETHTNVIGNNNDNIQAE